MNPTKQLKPATSAPVPLGFARSSLFGVTRTTPGKLRDTPIQILDVRASKMSYTGPQLNQHHALIWQALIRIALKSGTDGSASVLVPIDALLEQIGCQGKDSKQRGRVWQWLRDLSDARIEYSTVTHDCIDRLVLKASRCKRTGMLEIQLSPDILHLLSKEVLENDLARKSSLGRNMLALWLHDYIASHQRVPALPVSQLLMLCGSCLALPQFRQRLEAALKLLKVGKSPLVKSWKYDSQDRLIIDKVPTSVNLGDHKACEETPAAVKAMARKTTAITHARTRRADVAL